MQDGNDKFRIEDLMSGGSDCQDAIHTLYVYLDGELTDERRVAIRTHLEHCGECLQAFDWEAELKVVVSRCCRDQVPDGLKRRIADVLAEASEAERGNV